MTHQALALLVHGLLADKLTVEQDAALGLGILVAVEELAALLVNCNAADVALAGTAEAALEVGAVEAIHAAAAGLDHLEVGDLDLGLGISGSHSCL